ncbi:MAG: hypothetical protein ABIB46_06625 [bacterium]
MNFLFILLFINIFISPIYAKSYKGYIKMNENYSYYSIYEEKKWAEKIFFNLEKSFNLFSKTLLETETNLQHTKKYAEGELLSNFNYNFSDDIFFKFSNEFLFSHYYEKSQQGNNEINEKANFAFNFIFLDDFSLELGNEFKYNKFKNPNSFNYDYNSYQIKTNLDYAIFFNTNINIGVDYLIFKMLSFAEELSQEDFDLLSDLYAEEEIPQKNSKNYEEYGMALDFEQTFNTEINLDLEYEMRIKNYYNSSDKNKLWEQNALLNFKFPLFSNLKTNLKNEMEIEDYAKPDEYNTNSFLLKFEPEIEYNLENFIFKISYVREKKKDETDPTYSYLKRKLPFSIQYENKIFYWEVITDLEKNKCPFDENYSNKKYWGNTTSFDFTWRLNSLWKFFLWSSYAYRWYSTEKIEEINFLFTTKIQYSF